MPVHAGDDQSGQDRAEGQPAEIGARDAADLDFGEAQQVYPGRTDDRDPDENAVTDQRHVKRNRDRAPAVKDSSMV